MRTIRLASADHRSDTPVKRLQLMGQYATKYNQKRHISQFFIAKNRSKQPFLLHLSIYVLMLISITCFSLARGNTYFEI